MFEKSSSELPLNLQELLKERWGIPDWDALTAAQRRKVAADLDAQHPIDLVAKEWVNLDFRSGFKKISVPRRNKKNRSKDRPRRQLVMTADIESVHARLAREGAPHHKRCALAWKNLCPDGRPTLRAFKKRWVRLGLNKKGT